MKIISLESRKGKMTLATSVNSLGPASFQKNCQVNIVLSPAKDCIKFISNCTGNKKVTIPVNSNFLLDNGGEHTTVLGKTGYQISGVEHLLSALSGMNIDACDITLSGGTSVPAFEASAQHYCDLIKTAGSKNIPGNKKVAKINEQIIFSDNSGSLAILQPDSELSISALIQFPEPIGEQYYCYHVNTSDYPSNIGYARSFIRANCTLEYWEKCRQKIPILPQKREDAPVLVFENKAWIVSPKEPNEPVKHKILDVLGDLTALGYTIEGKITLIRPGHQFNHNLVRHLAKLLTD